MLTLPSEISNSKDNIAYEIALFVDFSDLNYWVATRSYNLKIGVSGSDGDPQGPATPERFESLSATFQADDVEIGMLIDINGTEYEITDVVSETVLEVSPDIGAGAADDDYYVYEKYLDLIKKDSKISIRQTLPELMIGIISNQSSGVNLTSWRSVLVSDLIGSSPDLTDSTVNIWIKFIPSSDTFLKSNALKLFSGQVQTWSENKDIMSVKLKNKIEALPVLPGDYLSDSFAYNGFDDTYCKQIQLGDFGLNTEYELWSDVGDIFAHCVYVGLIGGSHRVFVSDHEMNEMPTTGELANTNNDPHAFVQVNNNYVCIPLSGSISITNAGSGCYIDFTTYQNLHAFTPPTDEYSESDFGYDNAVTNFANALDGNASTSCTVDRTGENPLTVWDYDLENKYPGLLGTTGNFTLVVIIHWGDINISGDGDVEVRLRDAAGTSFHATTHTVNTGDANTSVAYSWSNLLDATDFYDEMENWAVMVYCSGTTGAADAEVQNIMINVEMIDVDIADYPDVFIKCKGMEYSGTWNSRKTSGNLIENPADALEGILRDYFSLGDSDIDMDAFDDVNSIFSSVNVRGTILKRISGNTFVEEFSKMFGLSIVKSLQWKILFPKASGVNFSSSGTGTPGNEDIFTDTDSISSNAYDQHPIEKDSFKISRSQELFKTLILNYSPINEEYKKSTSSGSTGNQKTIDNYLIGDATSAAALKALIYAWISVQKNIVSFNTFYNAIAHEIADVINVRHDDLADDMLDATVNTQKWAIFDFNETWHPAIIMLRAIELI